MNFQFIAAIFLFVADAGLSFHIPMSSLRSRTVSVALNEYNRHDTEIVPFPPHHEQLNTLKTIASVGAVLIPAVFLRISAVSATDESLKSIVVIGGGGKTGQLVVKSLSSKGFLVRPSFRDPTAKFSVGDNIGEPIYADVKDLDSLVAAVKDATAVVFAASASKKGGSANEVDNIGVQNIAKACILQKVPRLVVISSAAITRPDSLGFRFTNVFGRIMEYKYLGENGLKEEYQKAANPSLSYVIIRPGGLTDNKALGANGIELNQGDTIVGDVTRADVAECAAAAAVSKLIPKDVTFEIYQADKKSVLEGRFPPVSGYERTGSQLGGDYEKMFSGLVSNPTII